MASVLALQRSIGNSATRRLLARSPRKPYQNQWENPALAETIYASRDVMLRKFVSVYREVELLDITDPAARQPVIDATRKAMKAEVERLEKLTTPDEKRIKQLKAVLDSPANTAKAYDEAVAWERQHRTDGLAGPALLAEVKRLFGAGAAPKWLESMVLNYAGMRYDSAHESYYSPVRLLYFLERARGTFKTALEKETKQATEAAEKAWEAQDPKKRPKKAPVPKLTQSSVERAAMDMTADDALAKLEKMRDAGEIPDWAWHKIVRLTELRTWYAEKGWEDTAPEKPPPGADATWVKVIDEWSNPKGQFLGNKLGWGGGTGWREEAKKRNVLVTTRMVCDQISELTQLQRGVNLRGGISENAKMFSEAAAEGAKPGAKKNIAGSYFKEPKTLDDFRPGAALFWVQESFWEEKEPDPSNQVIAVAGGRYPMPTPPEYKKAWIDWSKTEEGKKWLADEKSYKAAKAKWENEKRVWDQRTAKAKTQEQKDKLGPAPVEPAKPADLQPEYKEGKELASAGGGLVLPADGKVVNGWTYRVTPGKAITRSKDGVTHWLRWKHQATVLKVMPDKRIITWETTMTREGGQDWHGTGVGTRWLSELTQPGVFVGYIPGEVDPPLTKRVSADDDLPLIEDLIIDFVLGTD
jgi:hypothetical protein